MVALWPVLFAPGWPMNHELTAWAERLAVHASALRAGDLFPLWWDDGAFGLGAPMPLLYHKLFNMVAAPAYLLSGRFQTAAAATIALFGVVGVYGLRAAGSVVIHERAGRWLGLIFPHLNYALTNWLVRGAFAEFAAMAVATWLLWWCLQLACQATVRRGFPLIATALLLAHSVIAFLGGVAVALAVLVGVAMNRAQAPTILIRLIRPTVVTALITAPLGLLMAFVLAHSNTAAFFLHDYHPTKQYVAWWRYVYDPGYRWGTAWQGFTVRLDAPLLLAVGVGLVAALLRYALRRGTTDRGPVVSRVQRRAWVWLGAVVLVFGVLQLPVSSWEYLHVPGLSMIQFPWRLLAYLSPTLVIVAGLALDLGCSAWGHGPAPWAAALAASLVATSPALRPIRYEWIPGPLLEAIAAPEPQRWPEYWPRPKDSDPEPEARVASFARRGVEDVGGGRCRGAALRRAYLVREYEVECVAGSIVALPVAGYGLERVELITPGQHRRAPIPAARTHDDPRLRVALPPGRHRLRVELPTTGRLLGLHARGPRAIKVGATARGAP